MIQKILKRVDLHVHTVFSRFRHLKILRAKDSYSDPLKVYERCRDIGCDYVAITDHDSVEGAVDLLARRPDLEPTVIIGEEVETRLPDSGQWLHVNVLDIDESIHADITRARENVYDLVDYFTQKNLVHFLNHPLQSYKMQKAPMSFVEEVLQLFTHVEIGNGTLSSRQNQAVAGMLDYGRRNGLLRFGVGGSDAHGIRHIGAYTTLAPGEDRKSWLRSLARGECLVEGREVGLPGMIHQVYEIIGQYYQHLVTGEGRSGMTPANYAAAAGFVPICALGVPLVLQLLNHAAIGGMSEVVRRSLIRAQAEMPAGRWADGGWAGEQEG